MRLFSALALMLGCVTTAHGAEALSRNPNGDWARITDTPCTNKKIMAHVPEPFRSEMSFYAGQAQIDGKVYPPCWTLNPMQQVILVYEDGNAGRVPLSSFASTMPLEPKHQRM